MSEKNHKHYNSSKNTARNIEEVKKTRMYVERKDGTNISGIIIPHDAQIGINDDNFRSNLGVKGDLKVEGKIYDKNGDEVLSVDVSDFMTNGSDNRVITATGTDAMNAEANLTFDGSTLSITGDISLSGDINCTSTPLTIGSLGDVSILLDTNNNSSNKFKIINGGGLEVFTVNESGYFESIGSADFTLDSNNNQNAYFIVRNSAGDAQVYLAETGESWFNFSRNAGGDFQVRGSSDYGLIFTDAGENAVALGYDGDASPQWADLTETGTDVKVLLSGSAGTKDTSTRGVTLVAGDLVVSGTIYDGTGADISSGGGSGSPGGSDTQVQFNDGGSFGGDSGLTYNKTTDTLTVGNLDITSSPSTGFVPKSQYFNEHFYLSAIPSGNPTVDLHLEWNDGGVTNADAENSFNNHFWKYFPYGGEIVSVFANGSTVADSSPSNPFTQDMVIMLWTWSDAFVSDSDPHTDGMIGYMTASAGDKYAQNGASYYHRSLYDFSASTKNGTFVIPSGQLAALSVKGEGTGNGFGRLNISVVYKMNLK